jgi:hypothetical protein
MESEEDRRFHAVMRRARFAVALAVLPLVLTGCYRSDFRIKVNDDGSGSVDIVVAIDPEQLQELAEQFGDEGEFGADPCAELRTESEDTSTLPEGADVEPYDEDGYCGVRVKADFPADTDIQSFVLDDLDFGASEDSPVGFESFVIERDGDGWRFEATTVGATGTEGADAGLLSGFLGDASNIVRVELPGHVVDENADRVEDGSLVWDLDVLGDARTLAARSEPGEGGGGSGVLWIVLGAVVVAAAAVIGLVLWRRGHARPAPGAPAPAGPAPAPQWDPQRNAYVQWDPAGDRWMQYDDAAGEWGPLS